MQTTAFAFAGRGSRRLAPSPLKHGGLQVCAHDVHPVHAPAQRHHLAAARGARTHLLPLSVPPLPLSRSAAQRRPAAAPAAAASAAAFPPLTLHRRQVRRTLLRRCGSALSRRSTLNWSGSGLARSRQATWR